MNWKIIFFMPLVLVCALAHAGTPQVATASECGIDLNRPAGRILAKVNDQQPWREYKRIQAVPELDLGFGISAELWTGLNKSLFIRTVEPGEDFWAYTSYCFRDGQLIRVAYELRTAWGWAFRTGGPVKNGAMQPDSSGFFSTETDKPISKPEGADDVREALTPTLYPQVNQLPFTRLLRK